MPACILTTLGKTLIRNAAGDGSAVAISHVALGDGLGVAYDPAKTQTALRRERARQPIERRHALGADSWRVVAEFPPETPAFTIREMGFFTAANEMIALWAGLDIDVRQAGVIAYIVDHVLNFSDVDSGLVIIDAPDDDLFDLAILQIESHAILAAEQFRQALEIRALKAQI